MSTTATAPSLIDPVPRAHPAGRGCPAPAERPAGRFRGDLSTDQWWWSPEVYDLHGLPAGSVRPTIGLLLAHVHAADRAQLRGALSAAGTAGTPFTQQYRVLRPDGVPRTALLVCEPETAGTGAVTALAGLVVDVTDHRAAAPAGEEVHRLETEIEQLRSAMASRASIEQAKGVLMLLMGCGDQVAFDLLAHISSHTHRKVRDVAASIVESATGRRPLPDDVREILHDACPPSHATG
jgi:PAS domain-containing protein